MFHQKKQPCLTQNAQGSQCTARLRLQEEGRDGPP